MLIPLPDADVSALVRLVTEHDGRSPVNELGELALAGHRPGICLAERDTDGLNGFALVDQRERTAQVAVHPQRRGRGIGTRLVRDVLGRGLADTFWAFGDSPSARAVASKTGLVATRRLLFMGRPLGPVSPSEPPPGVVLRPFSDADAADIVRVNAAAFASHPEQGRLTLADFHTLAAQPWFDPDGLIVATIDGRIAGFHWTKRHDATTGEVYVLAVHPDAEGRGLGRALLEAGLTHLRDLGMTNVTLYVEAKSHRVVAMYEAAGFQILNADTSYARKDAQ